MKRAAELELALAPRAEGVTLQRWLCGELRAAILAGRLAPGCRLPSTRDFARQPAFCDGLADQVDGPRFDLTQLFADRLADSGINVYEIRPGVIATDMTSVVKEKYDAMIANGLTPIKRWGQPDDVAKAVWAACSGLLDFSTGEVINVDGGFHLRRL